jgi:tetrahydromethanopterin S-methyltransferase subunit B
MAKIYFEPAEKKLMEEVLTGAIADLRSEITHTDIHEYKEKLKKRKQILINCLEKVRHGRDETEYSLV